MRFDGNEGGAVNYEPNSMGGPVEDPSFKEPPLKADPEYGRGVAEGLGLPLPRAA